MNLQEYVQGAIETESRIDAVQADPVILSRVLGAMISAGNLLDMVKKNVFYGKPVAPEKWNHEVGLLAENANRLSAGEYRPLRNEDYKQPIDPRLFHAIIGIATEATELLNVMHKQLQSWPQMDPVNLQEELGDLAWYQAIMVDTLGVSWEQILETNQAKLRARNKGRQFNATATIDRNVDAERKILEGGDARAKVEESYAFGGTDFPHDNLDY